VQLKRRPTLERRLDDGVARARRGGTGSKYVTFRGGLRRAIPFLVVRMVLNSMRKKPQNGPACICIDEVERPAINRPIAAVLMQVADRQRRDLGAPQADLQPDRQDSPIAQPGDRVLRRQVEQFAHLRFREGESRAFVVFWREAALQRLIRRGESRPINDASGHRDTDVRGEHRESSHGRIRWP
jgi:hypothetical protein